MDNLNQIFLFTRADSFGSIIVRGLIWLILVLIIAAGLDNGTGHKGIKSNMGWFLLAVVTVAFVSIILFGFIPTL